MQRIDKILCGGAGVAAAILCAASHVLAADPPASVLVSETPVTKRPTLMVLGSVHLGNPNHDLHDAQVDDVLAPDRQRQIERLVSALAAWKPTRVAVEWPQQDQAELDRRYTEYRAGRRKLTANETDQIGLRLAAKLNLPRVEAVDWNGNAPGADADYDWQVGAKIGHEEGRLAALSDPKISEEETRLVRSHTVAGFLRIFNRPEDLADMNRVYYDFALLGGPKVNPGANWVGYWHARNLKILDNLIRLDARPDERILLVIGAGHAYLLNEYAPDSHAFRLERPDAWLARAE